MNPREMVPSRKVAALVPSVPNGKLTYRVTIMPSVKRIHTFVDNPDTVGHMETLSELKQPIELSSDEHERRWYFKGNVYEITGNYSHRYSDDEIRLLILEEFDKERRLFEKLKAKYDAGGEAEKLYSRPRIPENVRVEVWRRDGGKCARCGSREKLEYDHIVPISRGGSNTARNIELLCEKCNRSKSNNVV